MRTVAPVLALLLAPLAAAAPVPKAIKKVPDFYPNALGTKWVYAYEDGSREHSREVTAHATKDGVTEYTITWTEANTTQVWDLKRDDTGVYRTKQDGNTFDPPHKLLPATVQAGDEWTSEYTYAGQFNYKYQRTVGKPEEVKTPAGTFSAFPITSRNLNAKGDETTLWYADGVGLVKIQSKTGSPILLKEYTLGGKK